MKKKTKAFKQKTAQTNKSVQEEAVAYSYPAKKSMLNYASLEINNFRCLQNLHIEQLGRVNLITGINNVGKTSLLEGLFLHMGSMNPALALLIDSFRGLEILNEMAGSRWRTLFWQFKYTAPIRIVSRNSKGSQRSLTITLKPSSSTIFEGKIARGETELESLGQDIVLTYKDDNKKPAQVVGTPMIIKKEDIVRLQLKMEPLPPPPPFPGMFISSRHQGGIEEGIQRFSDLRKKRQDEFILGALKFIEPRLEKLEILSYQGISMLHGYLKGYDEPVPSPLLGDGVKRVMSLLLAIGSSRNGVVLVDEVENGIHHSLMPSVWGAIAEGASLFNAQVFATTHSAECVYAAHEAFKAREYYDFKLHRLDRVDGVVKAVTYDQESLEGALSIPLEVRG
ncbi:MAG: AAA family ATPase [Pseudomonadota bacterium]